MKFKIEKVEILKVTKEGENLGKEYVRLTVAEDSMFAERSHTMVIFPTDAALAKWKAAQESGTLPTLNAQYEIVEYPQIPHYKVVKDGVAGDVRSSIKVLIPLDGDGKLRVAPQAQAMQILKNSSLIEIVDEPLEVHVAEDIPL